MGAVVILVIAVIRIDQVVDASDAYTRRLDWNKTQLKRMEEYPEKRFVMHRN